MPETPPPAPPAAPAPAPATSSKKSTVGKALVVAAAGAALLAILLRSSKAQAQELDLSVPPPGVPPEGWAKYGPLINQVASEVGIPASVLAAIVSKESVGWRNDAPRRSQCPYPCVSRYEPPKPPRRPEGVCSYGLAQVLTTTAARYGISGEQLCDPYWGLKAGALYLKDLYDDFGDWATVFAAYNAGEGRAESPPKTTREKYVPQAMNYMQTYQKAGLSGMMLRVRARV